MASSVLDVYLWLSCVIYLLISNKEADETSLHPFP